MPPDSSECEWRLVVQRKDGAELVTPKPSEEAAREALDRLRRQDAAPFESIAERVFVERREIGPWTVQEVFDAAI
jgi:hypothetical protein